MADDLYVSCPECGKTDFTETTNAMQKPVLQCTNDECGVLIPQ